MPALRKPWFRVAVLATVALAAAGIAIGVREVNGRALQGYAAPGDERLVLGLIGDPANARDREIEKGLRMWLRRLDDTTRGIPYADGRVTAVEVVSEHTGARGTAAAVNRLLARGASAIIGPSDQNQLSAVIEGVRRRPVLVLSALPRGRSVRRVPQAFHLSRADPFTFATAYDVLGELGATRRTPRVTLLAAPGPYAVAARRAAAVARARALRPEVVVVEGDAPPAKALREPAAAVLVSAPLRTAVRWYRAGSRRRAGPWVIGANDVGPALDAAGKTTVAVSVPWSPTSDQSDTAEFAALYAALHGRPPTTDAAAGATLGIVLANAAQYAKATTGIRLIAAMERLDVLTPWGQVRFKDNTSGAPPAQLVLLERGRPRPIFPFPSAPGRLRESVPPVPTPTTTPEAGAVTAGTAAG